MAKVKKEKKLKTIIISGVTGLILGVAGHIGYVGYDDYHNRPKLLFKINSFTVSEVLKGSWEMHIILYQENTGNSESLYKLNECNVLFPSINKEPIKIIDNKSYVLNRRSNRTDTVIIPIPEFFKDVNIDKFSSFENISLSFVELRSKKPYLSKRDSSEILTKGILGIEENKPFSPKDYLAVKKNGDTVLVRGIHPIVYKGKTYINYVFPHDGKAKYQIIDDKIYIEFLSNGNKPLYYFPNEELKDKIVFPKTAYFTATYEQKTDKGKQYVNFGLNQKNEEGVMYFFIFKD